jgi:hypothetical protein
MTLCKFKDFVEGTNGSTIFVRWYLTVVMATEELEKLDDPDQCEGLLMVLASRVVNSSYEWDLEKACYMELLKQIS